MANSIRFVPVEGFDCLPNNIVGFVVHNGEEKVVGAIKEDVCYNGHSAERHVYTRYMYEYSIITRNGSNIGCYDTLEDTIDAINRCPYLESKLTGN